MARPVQTTVNYWTSNLDREPPVDENLPFNERKMIFYKDLVDKGEERPVTIDDIRGHEEDFTLDKQGFQLYRQQIKTQVFTSDQEIKASYYPEVEALLKTVFVDFINRMVGRILTC